MKKILIIQTAFIGDVILATGLVEKLHADYPTARIDFLLRKGNESLFAGHPFLEKVLVWDKKNGKYPELIKTIIKVRREKYDTVFNLQRFFSSGLITILSGAKTTVGFNKNPLFNFFSKAVPHQFGTESNPIHEVDRIGSLLGKRIENQILRPQLYPAQTDFKNVKTIGKYITISPGSVWFTKQWPEQNWIQYIDRVGDGIKILLLGGKQEIGLCESIRSQSASSNIRILAGKLSLLQSAALMKGAVMNYVNDSAPLHLASAVNAPVTAIFCSTVKEFGFTPLSDDSAVLETQEKLSCRPCGLHGKKKCPQGHFNCAKIDVKRLLDRLP